MKIPIRLIATLALVSITGFLSWSSLSSKATAEARTSKEARYKSLAKGSVNYNKHIAPILHKNCATCHHAGEVAPFALMDYKDAKKRAKQLTLVTQSGLMPPWKAEHGFGEFAGEMRLTEDEKGLIKQWAEDGMPEGSTADKPSVPVFPKGWTVGTPDLIAEMPEAYQLGASGNDEYRCFVIPTNYSEDRYIRSVEVKPGNRNIVHHVIAYLDTTGEGRKKDVADPAPGYITFGGPGIVPSGVVAGWAPGNQPYSLPDGIGMLLPKHADIIMEVHYHKSGKAERDQTKIGLAFQKAPVDKRVRSAVVINPFLNIPAGKSGHPVEANVTLPGNVHILGATPHMHLLGTEMTVTAITPNGTTLPLVRVPKWDFNWQISYNFKEALAVPKGTRLHLLAKYDNSSSNPNNPSSPPRDVRWGEQTTDEMCIAFVSYLVDDEHLLQGIEPQGYPDFGGGGRRKRQSR
ncbi:hypothetical protein LBMAG21_04840 [Armatimonadota bacterium]|nr:hypothetical protein LBMAG21_04840 [Armatimonadota bacterium]